MTEPTGWQHRHRRRAPGVTWSEWDYGLAASWIKNNADWDVEERPLYVESPEEAHKALKAAELALASALLWTDEENDVGDWREKAREALQLCKSFPASALPTTAPEKQG